MESCELCGQGGICDGELLECCGIGGNCGSIDIINVGINFLIGCGAVLVYIGTISCVALCLYPEIVYACPKCDLVGPYVLCWVGKMSVFYSDFNTQVSRMIFLAIPMSCALMKRCWL
jgi:hypothetical protein